MEIGVFFIDSQKAFEEAIDSGLLSVNEFNINFAGNYMYMGTDKKTKKHLFKHIISRQYI